MTPQAPERWPPGIILGERYRLDRRIGAGAMGEVWAAEHVLTRRAVALKALLGRVLPGSQAHRRFEQEARTSAQIGHPAVVETLDAFLVGDTPVLVMELCIGETLAARLDRVKTISTEELCAIFIPVSAALVCAHEKGIVHRDLKPENLFLCADGGALRPKVLDFGLAKLTQERSLETIFRTRTGAAVGTPSYMAPEQAAGDPSADHRVDIWAVGVMLYRCLSGVLPIEGSSAGEIIARIRSDAITPLEVLSPDVPRPLLALVGRMLSRDPRDRPESLGEVAAVLRQTISSSTRQPTHAPPTPSAGRDGRLTEGALFHDRYRVIRPLGAGAMGAVYEVFDVRTHGRRALKILLPALVASADQRSRFAREATVTGGIESPHIALVFDAGVDRDTPFLVMELLSGEDLQACLDRRGPLPREEVVELSRQIAAALAPTAAAGVVHRDLKPSNLFLVSQAHAPPLLKLMDFGIAKIIEADPTRKTMALGTPLYMSPEQATGEASIDARADLYAFAHVTYALLTGEPYFAADAESCPTVMMLVVKIMNGPTEPPTARALRRRGVALPSEFDAWFATAAAPDPRARFGGPRAQAAALEAALRPATPANAPLPPAPVPPAPPATDRMIARAPSPMSPVAYASTAFAPAPPKAPQASSAPPPSEQKSARRALAIGAGAFVMVAAFTAVMVLREPKPKASNVEASASTTAPAVPTVPPAAPGTPESMAAHPNAALPGDFVSRWASYDPQSVEPLSFATDMLVVVREKAPDASLNYIVASGVDRRGLVNLAAPARMLSAGYRAESLSSCIVVSLSSGGAAGVRGSTKAALTKCTSRTPMRVPTCALPKLISSVSLKSPTFLMKYPSYDGDGRWSVHAEDEGGNLGAAAMVVTDACP